MALFPTRVTMKKLIIPFLLLACTPTFALKEHYGLSRSIRALGMGGAFYGLSDDEYALFYNPAGFRYRGDGQGMISFNFHASPKILSAIKTVTDTKDATASTIADKLAEFQGTPLYAASLPFSPIISQEFRDRPLAGGHEDSTSSTGAGSRLPCRYYRNHGFGLFVGYATDFEETLHVGVNAKAIARAGGKKNFSVSKSRKART